jgi:spore coat polysaccharide biosynthesis protein SpsF
MSLASGVTSYKGSVEDVLDRFYQAAKNINPEWVVRVTSDCPLIDPLIIDAAIALAKVNDVDYCSNTLIEHFPDGQDVEVFKFSALQKAWEEAELKSEREHVTTYIRKNINFNGGTLFSAVSFPCYANFSDMRMTVDEPNDFELIQRLINDLGANETWLTYTKHIINNNLYKINEDIIRNEGFLKSLKND